MGSAVNMTSASPGGLTSRVGALTMYFVDATAPGSSHGTLQIGGIAPSVATMGTGWTFGTVHSSNEFSDMTYGSVQPASSFSTTAAPTAGTGTTKCFRTPQKLTGNFKAGNWVVPIATIMTVAGTSGNANLRFRVFRSTDPTGTGATEITVATQALSTWVISTTTQQNKTKTWAAPAFNLEQEYLFISIGCEVVSGAVSVTGSTAKIVQDGTNSKVTTASFATCPNTQNYTCIFWVMFATQQVNTENIFSFGDVQDVNQLQINVTWDGTGAHFVVFNQDTSTTLITAPAGSIGIGVWQAVALLQSGTNVSLYTGPIGTNPVLYTSSGGTSGLTPTDIVFWDTGAASGTIINQGPAKLFWNQILTATQIQQEFLQTAPVLLPTAYWDWEPGGGGIYADKTGNGFNLVAPAPAQNRAAKGPPIPKYLNPRRRTLLASGLASKSNVCFDAMNF